MCRVWMCKACGQVLPEGLRCMSLFGMMFLIIVAALTLGAMYVQHGIYYGLLLCFVVAALGYLLTYGGIRVCSPSLIVVGTLFHFILLFLLPAAIFLYAQDVLKREPVGEVAIVYGAVFVASVLYALFELYYTMASCSAFALLNRQDC